MIYFLVRHARLAVLVAGLLAMGLIACTPTAGPVSSTRGPATTTAVIEPTPVVQGTEGWCAGGPQVILTEDVSCYLDQAAAAEFEILDSDTLLLFAKPEVPENWAGGAFLVHQPSLSMIVLDTFGDVDPAASFFSNRAGLAALESLTADVNFMTTLKARIQERFQTSPTNTPEVRLGLALQDGRTNIFLISTAGLSPQDGRFYCPSQEWDMGNDETISIIAECIERDPDAPVRMHFFETLEIQDSKVVTLKLNGVASNEVQAGEGVVSEETAVYAAVLRQITGRTTIIRGETGAAIEAMTAELEGSLDPILIDNFLRKNERPQSLRFLFQHNDAYSVQPGEAIDLNYLTSGDPQSRCQTFREEYQGLGGIISLSSIGYSVDESQALVYAALECGSNAPLTAAFYTLTRTDDDWKIADTYEVAPELTVQAPALQFTNQPPSGCGNIFVYKSDPNQTEFILAEIDAASLGITAEPQTFEIADYPDDVSVQIDYYGPGGAVGELRYCNDVFTDSGPQSVWQAVSGTMTVSSTAAANYELCVGDGFEATVILEAVTFENGDETLFLESLTFEDVRVGWCAG